MFRSASCSPVYGPLYAPAEISWHLREEDTSDPELSGRPTCGPVFQVLSPDSWRSFDSFHPQPCPLLGASLFYRLYKGFHTGHQETILSHQQSLPQGDRSFLLDHGSSLPLLCSNFSCSFHSIQSKRQIPADTSDLPVCSGGLSNLPQQVAPILDSNPGGSLTFDSRGLLSTLLCLYARLTLAVPEHLVLNRQPSPHGYSSLGPFPCDSPP